MASIMKKLFIYDLDNTLINSNHRYATLDDGSIDLPYWIANATPEKVALDKLMPLAAHYKAALANASIYVVVATARLMAQADHAYVAKHLGTPDYLISRKPNDSRHDAALKCAGLRKLFNLKPFRGLTKLFLDDNIHNIAAVRTLGVRCIHVQ